MDPVEDLQFAVEWYQSVVPKRRNTAPSLPPDPASRAATIEEIRRELHPLVLSRELEWFWSTWEAPAIDTRFDVLTWPGLTTPDFALSVWQYQRRGEFPGMPAALFPVAYESHGYLLADLTAANEIHPAPLWLYYGDGADPYRLMYPSLAGLFRTVASALESSGISVPDDRSSWDPPAVLRGDTFDTIRRSILAASTADSNGTDVPVLDQRQWPDTWQRASGLVPEDLVPFGATHTVAELAAAAKTGAVTARLQGRCSGCFGPIEIDGEWVDIRRFTDDTGAIDVLQPVGLRAVGVTGDVPVEIEVTCRTPIAMSGNPSLPPSSVIELAGASAANDSEQFTAALESLQAHRHPEPSSLPRINRMVIV